MPSGFTENHLVERPAVNLFGALGWASVSATEEVFGSNGTLGRETKSEVVLVPRLRAALGRLNPARPVDLMRLSVYG